MDEATLARSVEPLLSTKEIGNATGPGLSMVHGLAAQRGGGLVIQSRRRGTNGELWLALSMAPLLEIEARSNLIEAGPARGLAYLVEDEEVV